MTAQAEISVVMANYNGSGYLAAAVRSLQAQTFSRWELIFVDDASSDSSVAIANALAREDGRIKVVQQHSNKGPAAARNRALKLVQGRWIAVFDSDDIMLPHRLETLRNRAISDGAPIVADNLLVFDDHNPERRPFLPPTFAGTPRWIGLAEYIDSNRLYARTPDLGYLKPFFCAELFRRHAVSYDEQLRIGEDYDLMARLLASGIRLRLEPGAYYLYRKHAGSISHRLGCESIVALLEANERLAHHIARPCKATTLALRRRRRSLESMLQYDRVIRLLKAGRYGYAAAISLGMPRIWPLLTRPVSARLNRLRRRTRRQGLQTQMVPEAD